MQPKHLLPAVVALLVFTRLIAYGFGHRAALYLVCRGLEDAASGLEKPERNSWSSPGRLTYCENRYGEWWRQPKK